MSIFLNPTTQLLTPYSVNLSGDQGFEKADIEHAMLT
jgi:hypothetical protein